MSDNTLLMVAAIFMSGCGAGFLAGLFGVGGGILIIPALFSVFTWQGVAADQAMHLAVATSLMAIIPTSLTSFRTHYRAGKVDSGVLRHWALPVIIGSAIGTIVGHSTHGTTTMALFGAFMGAIALYMGFAPEKLTPAKHPPAGGLALGVSSFIGFFSSLIGVGGGVLAVPSMVAFGLPMHRAVGTASGIGFLIGIPATITTLCLPVDTQGLPPGSIGYVNLWAFLCLVPATMMTAPIGAKVAHRLHAKNLRKYFAVLLVIIAIRMLWAAFA